MKKILVLIISSFIFLSSCKSKKNANNTKATKMLVKEVVKNYENNKFHKKTVSASIKAKYRGKENLPSVNVSLRIQKDKIIWMSISKFISIGKLKITPKRVQFYNKLTKEYFDGDFKLLSNFLGTEVSFEQVQNIFYQCKAQSCVCCIDNAIHSFVEFKLFPYDEPDTCEFCTFFD